jgi:hypothetical protein
MHNSDTPNLSKAHYEVVGHFSHVVDARYEYSVLATQVVAIVMFTTSHLLPEGQILHLFADAVS